MATAHFVNHTHWDREWYFTSEDAQVLSDQLFANILDELESHPEANFTLDGQTSIVDEYIAFHPEDLERVRALMARHQLFIGPWYTQTDANLPDAESIIRNLVIGINDTKRQYGDPMMVGYLPDTFGFNAQLPMLLNQVGIQDFIYWRGTNFKRQQPSVYFKWHGLGNSQVYAANFPLGYYTGQITVDSKRDMANFVKNRLDTGIDFEAEHGGNDTVLLPSGIDQMNIIHSVSETLKEVNKYSHNKVILSDYPTFMNTLRNKDLPDYKGELRLPTYARVHRTIGSVRSRIKRQNFELEQAILKRVEPLMVIGSQCGVQVSNGLVLKLWKKLLECQPHDTLGGSVSDNVAEDIDHRFKEGFELADGIENYIKKRITQRLKLNSEQALVFNTETRPFAGYKDIKLVVHSKNIEFSPKYKASIIQAKKIEKRENIMQMTSKGFEFKDEPAYYLVTVRLYVEFDGLGYQVVSFKENANQTLPELTLTTGNTIQNDHWSVHYNGHGFDAKAGSVAYNDVIRVLDSGNDGDTYDYSPLRGDTEISLPLEGEVRVAQVGDTQRLVLSGVWQLAADLKNRVADAPDLKDVPYTLTLSLKGDNQVLDGQLRVNNTVLAHRLRLQIATGIMNDTTLSQIQGGFHNTINHQIDDDWEDEFVEKPVNIYLFDKIVGVHDETHGIFFLGRGQKEYERVGSNLDITLMATTGQLGKPNLLWRPGRASGDTTSLGHQMTPTPMAEELGINCFKFGLLATAENISENRLAMIADRWLAPSVGYQMQNLNLFVNRLDNKIWEVEFPDDLPKLSTHESILTLNPAVSVTAIYRAYTIKDATIVRLANESADPVDVSVLLDKGYQLANALEIVEPTSDRLEIPAYDMITLIRKDKS